MRSLAITRFGSFLARWLIPLALSLCAMAAVARVGNHSAAAQEAAPQVQEFDLTAAPLKWEI
jgi:hypothetical protein